MNLFASVQGVLPVLCEDGKDISSVVVWYEAKLSVRKKVVIQEVGLKLTLYNRLHDLADNTKQRDGPVHGWI